MAKEDFLHGMSAIPAKSISQQLGKNIVKKFRLSRIAERFVNKTSEERSNLGDQITRWTKQSKSECSVVRATRKLCGDLLKQEWNMLTKAWDLQKDTYKAKRTYVQACENSSDLPTKQLKGKLSHLGQTANMNIQNLLWTAAHLST